jgi:hypothetical protein
MKTKEKLHILKVKDMPCGVCGWLGPSDAHHILDCGRRISHFMVIPLCKTCHQDNEQGIHGRKTIWNIMKLTELQVLAKTIETLLK